MEYRYGSYLFPLEPKLSKSIKPIQDGPLPSGYRVNWTLTGEIFVNTAPLAAAARRDLVSAFREQRDMVIYNAAGSVVDALWNMDCVGGVSVETISIPESDGTEYATHLPFQITLSGVLPAEKMNPAVGDGAAPVGGLPLFCGDYTLEQIRKGITSEARASGVLWAPDYDALNLAVDQLIANLSVSDLMVLARSVTHERNLPVDENDRAGMFRNRASFSLELVDFSMLPDIYDFQEKISCQPGGPLTIPRRMIGAVPTLQTITFDPPIITQSGSCKGRRGYPQFPRLRGTRPADSNAPPPQPPGYALALPAYESPVEEKLTPSTIVLPSSVTGQPRYSLVGYPITWNYTYVGQVWGGAPPNPAIPVVGQVVPGPRPGRETVPL